MRKIDFAKKKVAVLGLGLEGRDLCRFLLKKGAKITVFDQKSASELGSAYKKFRQRAKFKLGKDYLKDGLIGFDFIFRSPGFYRFLPEIVGAEKQGTIISSATKLFFALSSAKIIGVTGTKGKGTTATLIHHILKEDGKDVYLGGNIGQPILSLLPKLKSTSLVVLELSSFQLMDFDKSPHIAVVLFITSEHLDYHKDRKEYIQAKANIVRHQNKNDFCVLNADNPTPASFASLTPAKIYYFSRSKQTNGAFIRSRKEIILGGEVVTETKNLKLVGEHNWDNICAAITASSLAGAGLKAIKKAILSFTGLEHRLERVRRFRGVEFYNDSFSTTPETAIAAIRAFTKPIILIAGGSEKGSDYTQLGREIRRSTVKTLILIGEMAGRIKEACQKAEFKGQIIEQAKNMSQIVNLAFKEASSGDVVLLSPACASFDMFKNYKDRGEQFKKYVQAL